MSDSTPHQNHSPASLSERDSQDLEQEYDPWSVVHSNNPCPMYAQMRQEEPVFFSPRAQAWVVSRYEDVTTVLKDHQRFAMFFLSGGASKYTPEVLQSISSSPLAGTTSLIACDPPAHTRLRSSVNKAMSAQRIANLEPRLRQLANQVIDGFEQDGRADFVAQFARPYPMMVVGSLLDLPEADLPHLHHLMDDLVTFLFADVSAEQQLSLMKSYIELEQYACDMVEKRRGNLRDDIISDLLNKPVDAGQVPLSVLEVADLLYRLFGAGFETTVNFLGNCLIQLLSEPRHWQALVNHPGSIPAVVEEMLRFNGPTLSTFRQTTQAVELGGKSIPEGAVIQVLLTSANHDESVFVDADVFNAQREKASRHMAFGYGIHFCLGAPLARLETRVALEQLSQRFPSLHLAPGQAINYTPNIVTHGAKQLFVEW
jgi:cytochrome P450